MTWRDTIFQLAERVTGQKRNPKMGEVMLADARERLFHNPGQAFTKYNPSILVGRKGIKIFDIMMRDDQIKAALRFKRYAVLASGWEVQSPEGKDKEWEPRKTVETQLLNLYCTLEQGLDEMLSALAYGFSLTEKVWRAPTMKFVDLIDMKTRYPFDVTFEQDAYGNILAVEQSTMPLPYDKFVHYIHDAAFSNPYGTSDLEAAYRAYWIKDNTYKWMAMLLERMGIPPMFALYDQSLSGYVDEIKKVMKNLQAATVAAIPRNSKESLELWSPELADNVAKVFIPALKQFNEDIARSLLLPGLLGFTPDGAVGSQARSQTHFDAFMLVVERIRFFAEVKVNRGPVRDIVDFNYATAAVRGEYPKFKFLPLTNEVKKELYDAWCALIDKGAVIPLEEDETHIRSALRMPERDGTPMPKPEPEVVDQEGKPVKPVAEGGRGKKGYAQKDQERVARRHMDTAERQILEAVRETLGQTRDVLLAAVRKDGATARLVDDLRLRRMSDVKDALEEGLRAAFHAGMGAVRHALVQEAHYDFTPREALAYLKRKSVEISGVLDSTLTSNAKAILLHAIKAGEPMGDTIMKLTEVFIPYIGDEEVIDDDELTSPYRLETIVRTNVTDAYNQGRLTAALDPELRPFLFGVRYSAILDERTTEVCRFLHGKVFRMDDPELLRLAPPNHFNCRSLVVPITKAEAKSRGIEADSLVTPEAAGRAGELAGKGFYSAVKPAFGYREKPEPDEVLEMERVGDGKWRLKSRRAS